ncbi:MAG: hypothetical protein Kow0077_22910 [Anaerolineae bacterium]
MSDANSVFQHYTRQLKRWGCGQFDYARGLMMDTRDRSTVVEMRMGKQEDIQFAWRSD